MPARFRSAVSALLGKIPTLLTLAALAGIAVLGVRNEWKLPSFATFWGGAPKAEEKRESTDVDANSALPAAGGLAYLAAFPFDHKTVHFPTEGAAEKAGLELRAAREQTLADEVYAHGMIDYDPANYAHLSARAAGTVWAVYKQLGQPVVKGELLALVESAEVGRAKAELLQGLNQYELREQALRRMQSVTSEAVPELRLREVEGQLREARIRLFNDLQALRNLGLDARREELLALPDERRVDHLRFLGLDDAARARVAAETSTANLLPLKAPFDGEVVQRNVARGEAVPSGESLTPGRPLFVLADLDHVHLELGVEPRDVPRLRVGQTITFVPEGAPQAVATGTLAHIGPEVDEKTRRVWVHGEADNPTDPARRLRPHTFGDGRVRIAERPHAVVVPAAAVQVDGRNSFVFVKVANESESESAGGGGGGDAGVRFQARTVQTGLRVGDLVEIVRGVAAGEQVVTTGSFALKSALFPNRLGSED